MPLPDGVYLHLPFDEYLEEEGRLGSTDKSTCWLQGEGWWWKSRHNPFRPKRKSTDEQLFGEAAHAVLLEGLHAYETRYCAAPDKSLYPGALTTIDEIKAALREAGARVGSTAGWKKDDWADAAEAYLPDRPVWDNIMEEFARRHLGRKPLSAEDDFAIRAMHAIGTSVRPDNQEMRELLSVGSQFPILAEVSVLYTDAEGIRHRARFDKLLPVVTADLKTVGNWPGKPLAETLDDHIKRSGYDVQLADYHVARQAMNRMLLESEDFLHGGTEEEREHILAMAEWNRTNPWGWAFIFYQKPDASGRAPVLFPLRHPWRGGYHLAGFRKRAAALATWRRCMDEFGPDVPWGRVEPVHYVEEGAEHMLPISPRDWGPDQPTPDEETHFQNFATGETP